VLDDPRACAAASAALTAARARLKSQTRGLLRLHPCIQRSFPGEGGSSRESVWNNEEVAGHRPRLIHRFFFTSSAELRASNLQQWKER